MQNFDRSPRRVVPAQEEAEHPQAVEIKNQLRALGEQVAEIKTDFGFLAAGDRSHEIVEQRKDLDAIQSAMSAARLDLTYGKYNEALSKLDGLKERLFQLSVNLPKRF